MSSGIVKALVAAGVVACVVGFCTFHVKNGAAERAIADVEESLDQRETAGARGRWNEIAPLFEQGTTVTLFAEDRLLPDALGRGDTQVSSLYVTPSLRKRADAVKSRLSLQETVLDGRAAEALWAPLVAKVKALSADEIANLPVLEAPPTLAHDVVVLDATVGWTHAAMHVVPEDRWARDPAKPGSFVAVVHSEWETVGHYYAQAIGNVGFGEAGGAARRENLVAVVGTIAPFAVTGQVKLSGSPPQVNDGKYGTDTKADLGAWLKPAVAAP